MMRPSETHERGANGEDELEEPWSEATHCEREALYGYEELVMDQYSEMYENLKHIVTGEYFASHSHNRNGDIYDWYDESGFKFAKKDPLEKHLENTQLRAVQVRNRQESNPGDHNITDGENQQNGRKERQQQ